jgi:hypothetical protein
MITISSSNRSNHFIIVYSHSNDLYIGNCKVNRKKKTTKNASDSEIQGYYIQGDSSFTAGGKIDLKNYDFTFIFCRPNLLSIRHIISKNEMYKLIRSNFAIFSIINCLIYSTL